MNVTQQTIQYKTGKETMISVNGCVLVYAVYDAKYAINNNCSGFVVKSFIAEDIAKIVAVGSGWKDVRRKARQYAKDNYHRHIEYHSK